MGDSVKKSNQTIIITNRETVEINEIEAIANFSEDEVCLIGGHGNICIEGEDLKIIELNKEKSSVEIKGIIKGVFYLDGKSRKKHGFWS